MLCCDQTGFESWREQLPLASSNGHDRLNSRFPAPSCHHLPPNAASRVRLWRHFRSFRLNVPVPMTYESPMVTSPRRFVEPPTPSMWLSSRLTEPEEFEAELIVTEESHDDLAIEIHREYEAMMRRRAQRRNWPCAQRDNHDAKNHSHKWATSSPVRPVRPVGMPLHSLHYSVASPNPVRHE